MGTIFLVTFLRRWIFYFQVSFSSAASMEETKKHIKYTDGESLQRFYFAKKRECREYVVQL